MIIVESKKCLTVNCQLISIIRTVFFYRILKVLELYNLPSIPALIQQLPEKDKWKDMVSESVAEHWRESLVRDARCN